MRIAGRLSSLLFAATVLALIAQALWISKYTVDDAFISFRFASNMVEGNGLVFNSGERVEGYTNFLWTLIMAATVAAGADPVAMSKVFGIMASIGTLLLVHRLSVLTRPEESPPFLSLLGAAALAASGAFVTAAITGLETSLFTLFVVAGAYAVIQSERKERRADKRLDLCAVFFAMSALTRPEGVVVFAVSVGFKAISHNFRRDDLLTCLRWCLIFGSIYLPYFIWRVVYYGDLLPNTFYAKTGAGLAQFYKGLLDLKAFSLTYLGVIFLLSLIVLCRRKSPFWLTYAAGLVVTFVLLHIYEGGDWIPFFRFLVPALPFYYLVIQEAARHLYAILAARAAARRPGGEIANSPSHLSTPGSLPSTLNPPPSTLRAAFILASLLLVALTAWPSIGMHAELGRAAKGQEIAHAALGWWLRNNGHGPIALMDIGRIGYISQLPIVDTSGLTDHTIAHAEGGLIDKKFDLAYVLNRQPEYFVLASTTDYVKGDAEPTDFPIEKRIYKDERFHQRYQHLFTLDSGWKIDGKGYFLMVYERK